MSKQDKLLSAKLAAMWVLLGACGLAGVVGLGLGLANAGKASKASVAAVEKKVDAQANPSRAAAIQTACAYVVQNAAQSGVAIQKCVLADPKQLGADFKPYVVKGDTATVVVKASDSKTGYVVAVTLSKGAYIAQGLQVAGTTKP